LWCAVLGSNQAFRPGYLRSVGSGWVNWALESFMDEPARAVKRGTSPARAPKGSHVADAQRRIGVEIRVLDLAINKLGAFVLAEFSGRRRVFAAD
jgi:hypothetical protein